jgi:hypothetical protein
MGKEELTAAISALENSIARLDAWVIFFGVLVIIGVLGETLQGYRHWVLDKRLRTLRETESQMHEADLAKLRSDTANADARAAEAKLELAKFKAPRTLNSGQLAHITVALTRFAKTQFDVAVGPMGDPEPDVLGTAISSALTNAGWQQIDWHTVDSQMTLTRPGRPVTGFASVTNIIIDIHPTRAAVLGPIAEALAAALNAEGIASQAQQGSGGRNTNENAIHVLIGRKM